MRINSIFTSHVGNYINDIKVKQAFYFNAGLKVRFWLRVALSFGIVAIESQHPVDPRCRIGSEEFQWTKEFLDEQSKPHVHVNLPGCGIMVEVTY